MPPVTRTLLVAGGPLIALSPAWAQLAPTPPAPFPPQVTSPSAPVVPAQIMSAEVPLDLGAIPRSASTAAVVPSGGEKAGTEQASPIAPETEGSKKPVPARHSAAAPAGVPVQRVLFDRLPVPVLLAPGRERLVQLPFVPVIDVPPSLAGVLEVQIIEDVVYLTARAPFNRSRLVAHAIDRGTKLPLDVEAAEGAEPAPILQVHLQGEAPAGGDDAPTGAAHKPTPAADMIQLTRYAAQVLYAPTRLVSPYPGVRQEPVDRKPVAGLYRGGAVETAPLGAWSSGPLHVTAIRFTNRSSKPVELDMERLRGRWIAATPQHWRLLPHGSEADTTAVYLVSDQPFAAVPLWR